MLNALKHQLFSTLLGGVLAWVCVTAPGALANDAAQPQGANHLISYPADEWTVSLIEVGKTTPEKAYCLAATQFEDDAIMLLAMKPDRKTSLALNIKKPLFETGKNYAVNLAFPSGVKGEFQARAENETTFIIQVGSDEVLWQNALNHSFFEVSGDGFGQIYSLDDFDFIQRTLERCATEIMDDIKMAEMGIIPPSQLPKDVKTLQAMDLFDESELLREMQKNKADPVNILDDLFGPAPTDVQQLGVPEPLSMAPVDPVLTPALGIPSLPEAYQSSGLDSLPTQTRVADVSALPTGNPVDLFAPLSSTQDFATQNFAGDPDLPPVLNQLLMAAGESVEPGSVEKTQDVDYVRYRWRSPDGKQGEFEQQPWPAGTSFYDMGQNYFARKAVRCGGKMMPSMSEPYRVESLALAEGKMFCTEGADQNFSGVAFFGHKNLFSSFVLQGPLAQMVQVVQGRDAVLKTLEGMSHPTSQHSSVQGGY